MNYFFKQGKLYKNLNSLNLICPKTYRVAQHIFPNSRFFVLENIGDFICDYTTEMSTLKILYKNNIYIIDVLKDGKGFNQIETNSR